MRTSRREFLKWSTVGGIALGVSRLALAQPAGFLARETLPGRGAWNPAAGGKGRIDGVAKVTGAKLYASDFRAADMPGWPTATSHVLLVRVPDATHVYEGLKLDELPPDAKPTAVVTQAEVERAGIRAAAFYAGDLFCPQGKTPLYLGQPAAMLLFDSFDAYDRARLIFRERDLFAFGAETGPLKVPNYAQYRFTRVAGPTPDSPDVYAPISAGWISPGFVEGSGRPIWKPLPVAEGGRYAEGARYGEQIRAELAAASAGSTLVLTRDFETQSIDPLGLETEAGLAWYDPGTKTLQLVLGVQSPYDAATSVAETLRDAKPDFKPARIDAQFASMGGSFGARDHTPFPMYVAVAAMFFPGKPVRLAHDRYQQFQGGIKRHAFKMRTQIGVDRRSGMITAFAADHVLDGGGLANFSASVATVSATSALGIYYVPKVDVTTLAEHTRGVTAGSMRGFGTLQTMTALEVLIDEVCMALPMDPIEFRRRNAMKTGDKSMTGTPYSVSIRTPELLDRLEANSIWRDRAAHKAAARPNTLVGTGVACVIKDYGTGGDCSQGSVSIDRDGRIGIVSDHTEMGNGIGTALANRVALHLGGMADQVAVAQLDDFEVLGLVATANSYAIAQEEQDAAAKNPRWVPEISTATAASNGAHVGTHAAAQAARVVFRYGLWPAALAIWGVGPNDPRSRQWEEAFWQDGYLLVAGLDPLPLKAIAAKAHEMNGVTGAMAHAFSRWAWAEATFDIGGEPWSGEIDALAIRRGSGELTLLDRTEVAFPPAAYNRIGTSFVTGCGTSVRIEIDKATGALRIAQAYTVLESGQALVPQLVLGQAQGGFAMGVGHALLEYLPPFEDGPGNGKWNLGDYLIARGSDLPLRDFEVEMLPPVSAKEAPKGVAEVVMIPIVAALLNAIADATGKRFEALPVTQAMLKGALS